MRDAGHGMQVAQPRAVAGSTRRSGGLGSALLRLAVLGALLLLLGCGRPETPKLRIALNTWPAYELIYLAQEKGYFRDAGVDVRLLEFGSLADARRAYELGRADALATTIVEVLMARDDAARDLRIVRLFDFSSGADMLVAGPETASVADLRGKRVGVELASLGVFILARALELEGLTLAEVEPVSGDQQSLREGLLSREFDAVVTYGPDSVAILREPGFHVVFSSRQMPGEVADVLAVDADILRQHPAQVQALLHGLDSAFAYLLQQPEDATRIMADREGLAPQKFRQLLTDGMTLVAPAEQAQYLRADGPLHKAVQDAARALRDLQLISSRPEVLDCFHFDDP